MNPCWRQTAIVALALAITITSASGADTPSRSGDGTSSDVRRDAVTAAADMVTLNLVNADIESVAKAVSEITGRNFVLDPRVKGTVNIISARSVPRAVVYDIFVSALRLQGFAVVEERGMVKIIPEADAKTSASRTYGPGDLPREAGDRIQTRIFSLAHESAVQMVPILRPLIAPNNSITAYPNNNTLVITDYAGNLQRLEKIISAIDQPAGSDPVVIPLSHASAVDVAATVNRLFAEASAVAGSATTEPQQRITVIADGRSNSLLVRSGNPARLGQLRKFIAILDSPTNAAGNIHVVYLKNAQAMKLAETLRAIYQGEAQPGGGRSSATPLAAPATALFVAPGNAAAASLGAQQNTVTAASPGVIQADAATNSIIITAPDAIYQNLRAVLDRLDVRPAQVYVEALIAEITADKAAEFGIQWQNLSDVSRNGNRAFGGTNFGTPGQNIAAIAQNPGIAGKGLNIGIVNGQVTVPGIGQILNLGLLVRALETDANANILSTPTLLTLDNEEAAIVIGQNVPFITGQYALSGTATTPTPFQTVERRDVGLTLRIKPQISEGGTVRLQIYQEVSSVQDSSNTAGVITNKRAVASTVLVKDGEIVVIGGLMQNTVSDGEQKVPVLGDIPILGGLFRYKTRAQNKTNLMIFLRPTLVRDSQQADAYTGDRYDYILGLQRKARPAQDAVLPDVVDAPLLPPRPLPPPPVDGASSRAAGG